MVIDLHLQEDNSIFIFLIYKTVLMRCTKLPDHSMQIRQLQYNTWQAWYEYNYILSHITNVSMSSPMHKIKVHYHTTVHSYSSVIILQKLYILLHSQCSLMMKFYVHEVNLKKIRGRETKDNPPPSSTINATLHFVMYSFIWNIYHITTL